MSNTRIPFLDLKAEVDSLWDELQAAIARVLRSGQFILGEEVEAFEAEAAAYLGARHAVAVNSGTDALIISLRALGIGPGDEVITTAFSFFATAEVISMLGAAPIFCDIDPVTFNIDPTLIERHITERTKAIVPVHLYGRPAPMEPILALAEKHGLSIVEDAAQSFGARTLHRQTGTLGHAGAFSFFPTKNLGGYGDGGLIATDDGAVAEMARMLRNHGSKERFHNEMLGYNSRLDALQAAILRVKLPYIDAWNEARRRVADDYSGWLGDVPGIAVPEVTDDHVFHQYTLRVKDGRRDWLRQHLLDAGIETMIYYPRPLHRLPVYADLSVHLPEAETAAAQVLSLPIWPDMHVDMRRRIAQKVKEALRLPETVVPKA